MTQQPLVERLQSSTESVYAKMTGLAKIHGAVNLGQGFPEDEPDTELIEWACEALRRGPNQYVSPKGTPEFRQAISTFTQKHHGVEVDPEQEIMVATGAEAALTAAFLSLVNPGDEIVIFAPYYMHFRDKAALVGATLKVVPLSEDGALELDELKRACTTKTKLVILNSPSNPLGRVLTRPEIQEVVDIVMETTRAYLIFDDAYEFFTFDGTKHVCGLSIQSARDRTITVSSLGKTFFATGWRVGYAMAAKPIVDAMAIAHLQMVYCVPGHLQSACAKGLARDPSFFQERRAMFEGRRNLMHESLVSLGIEAKRPQGGFFSTISAQSLGYEDDRKLAEDLVTQARVATVPLSPCFQNPDPEHHRIRFCFAKSEQTIREGMKNLKEWTSKR